jgi:hypothetical protein
MSDEEVQYILKLKDEFSGILAKFDAEANKAESAAERLQKHVNETSGAFHGLRTAVTAVAGAFGLYAGFEFFKGGLEKFKEGEQAMAQLEASLASTKGVAGITAEELGKLGDSLAGNSMYSKNAVTDMQALLLTFTALGKNIIPETSLAIADMSQKMHQDLQSTTIQVGKALQDPIKGITALHRVGVNFSESQKTMIERLVMTNHTLDAQKLILKELNTEFGGSSQAALAADPMMRVTKMFGSLQKQIGGEIEGGLNKLIPTLQKMIEGFKGLFHWIKDNSEMLKNMAIGVALVGTGFMVYKGAIALTEALAAAQIALNAAMTANPIGVMIIAVAALGVGMVALLGHMKDVDEEYRKGFTKIQAEAVNQERKNVEELSAAYERHGKAKHEADMQAIKDEERLVNMQLIRAVAESKASDMYEADLERRRADKGFGGLSAYGYADGMDYLHKIRENAAKHMAEAIGAKISLDAMKSSFTGKTKVDNTLNVDASSSRETRNTVINVRMENFMKGDVTFSPQNSLEVSMEKFRDMLGKAMAGSINDWQILAGQ